MWRTVRPRAVSVFEMSSRLDVLFGSRGGSDVNDQLDTFRAQKAHEGLSGGATNADDVGWRAAKAAAFVFTSLI